MPYDVVLFDLDGTLTDSLPGITGCIQYALEKMGQVVVDADALRAFVGPPLHPTFMQAFAMSASEADRAVALYRERFSTIGMFENAVYPGIAELLARAQTSARLAVATSKPTVYAEAILKHFQLDRYFAAIIGSYLDGRRVDKAEIIADALAALGPAAQPIMVGDRAHDIRGAHANAIPAIGVSYGYALPGELERAQPEFLVHSVQELGAMLAATR